MQQKLYRGLKEEDAYPADPEDGYGWENYSERMCRFYGRLWNWWGLRDIITFMVHLELMAVGRKSSCALYRKVANAKNNADKIEIWGDGKQTRSFLYIDDCVEGTLDYLSLIIQIRLILVARTGSKPNGGCD